MLGEPYQEGPYTPSYIEDLLKKLAALGAGQVVLTGVYFNRQQLGAAAYDSKSGVVSYAFSEWIEGYYHGTGDVFASALLAALLRDFDISQATQIAVDFTVGSIARTKEAGTDIRFGVNFEAGLYKLLQQLGL